MQSFFDRPTFERILKQITLKLWWNSRLDDRPECIAFPKTSITLAKMT